jgi:hypothetical protein
VPERYLAALEEALRFLREAAKIEFDPEAPIESRREAMELRTELLQRGTGLLNEATLQMREAVQEQRERRGINPDRKPAQRRAPVEQPEGERKTGGE